MSKTLDFIKTEFNPNNDFTTRQFLPESRPSPTQSNINATYRNLGYFLLNIPKGVIRGGVVGAFTGLVAYGLFDDSVVECAKGGMGIGAVVDTTILTARGMYHHFMTQQPEYEKKR